MSNCGIERSAALLAFKLLTCLIRLLCGRSLLIFWYLFLVEVKRIELLELLLYLQVRVLVIQGVRKSDIRGHVEVK